MAFVSACGSRPADLNAVWLKARIAERGRLKRLRSPRAPELERPLVGDDLAPRACCQQVGEHVSERSVRRGFRPRGIDELPEAVEWHGPRGLGGGHAPPLWQRHLTLIPARL
ncbi:hypothetical protein [Streptomyces manipurensis]|uniref:hypothetical protein n=1 Tax=Streptomyces manipurensis TaxID=1077945 RepID=UPI003C6F6A3A